MEDTTDTSFSSEESVVNSPIKNRFQSSRLSTSSNSHPSRSESSPSTQTLSSSSSTSVSPCSSSSIKQADGEELEKQLGIKPKYPCEMCGKKVIDMKSHVKRMHGEGTPGCTVACGQCDRTVLLSCLGQHVMDYHMETERSISPPSPISDVENTDQVIKQAASKNKSQKAQSPVPVKNNKLVPLTCSTSKRPPPQPSAFSSSKQPRQLRVHEEETVDDNSPVRDLDLATDVVIDTSSFNHTKHIVLPRLSRFFNTEIVVDINQNTGLKGQNIVAAKQVGAEVNDKRFDDNENCSDNVNPNMNDKHKENIQFWLKTQDRDLKGETIRILKIKIPPGKTVTVGRAKKSYTDKLGLDKDKQGELQFMVEGRKLEDEEFVEQLHNKTVLVEGLWFKA